MSSFFDSRQTGNGPQVAVSGTGTRTRDRNRPGSRAQAFKRAAASDTKLDFFPLSLLSWNILDLDEYFLLTKTDPYDFRKAAHLMFLSVRILSFIFLKTTFSQNTLKILFILETFWLYFSFHVKGDLSSEAGFILPLNVPCCCRYGVLSG
ncbi:hypothetical protein ILYODFUR_027567 [Ilyodon furcidens]|uniref:Uncharacterized protein n=1 Tax=Ilyodon furcidens TaxID=33524 RepID=A0ABV0TND3_9TELE